MSPTVLEPKHVQERVLLRFPFALEMPQGVTIVSVQMSCTTRSGTDPAAATMLSGAATIAAATGEVLQRVEGGVAGATYLVMAVATLSNGLVLVCAGELPVISF